MANVGRRGVLMAGAAATTSVLVGCSGDEGDDGPVDRGPIAIEELAFAANPATDRDEYERQPDATYERGDLVWLYADYSGLSGESVAEDDEGAATTVKIDILQAVSVDGPDRGGVVESEATFRSELTVPQLDGYYTTTEILLPGDAVSGEYETTVTVTDRISETETTETATFRIAN